MRGIMEIYCHLLLVRKCLRFRFHSSLILKYQYSIYLITRIHVMNFKLSDDVNDALRFEREKEQHHC